MESLSLDRQQHVRLPRRACARPWRTVRCARWPGGARRCQNAAAAREEIPAGKADAAVAARAHADVAHRHAALGGRGDRGDRVGVADVDGGGRPVPAVRWRGRRRTGPGGLHLNAW